MTTPAVPTRHSFLGRWLPGIAQVVDSPRGAWRGDLVGGLSVCVVMVPSVLAYAELAGVAPASGLYAALAAMIAYAALASSRRIIVGPDTTIALLLPYSLFFAATLHVSDYVSYREVFHSGETLAPLSRGS